MVNLIWKWFPTYQKMKKDHPIFIYFGVKKFTTKNDPKNWILMFECHNVMDPPNLDDVSFEIHVQEGNYEVL